MTTEQKAPSLLEAAKIVSAQSKMDMGVQRSAIVRLDDAIAAHEQQNDELLTAIKTMQAELNHLAKYGEMSSKARNIVIALEQGATATIAKAEGK